MAFDERTKATSGERSLLIKAEGDGTLEPPPDGFSLCTDTCTAQELHFCPRTAET